MRIRPATHNDLSFIYHTLKKSKDNVTRRSEDLLLHVNEFLILENEKIIGFVSLEPYTRRIAELRSLWVDKVYRRKQLGIKLVKKALTKRGRNQEVFVVTKVPKFFNKLGFKIKNGEKFILFK